MRIKSWDEFLRQRQRDCDALVEKYGLQGVKEALACVGWTNRQGGQGGRPKIYDAQHLMDVWIFVQLGVERTGLSVNKFCESGHFYWICAGDQELTQSISGPTLRRRYCEAEALLRNERLLESANRAQVDPNFMSRTEAWWRAELENRRAAQELSGNPIPNPRD